MTDPQVAHRFRLVLDMYDFGERTARSAQRRRHPRATDEQITLMLCEWRRTREAHPQVTLQGGRRAGSG